MGEVISFLPSCEFYFNLGMTAFSKHRYRQAVIYLKRAQSLAKTDDDFVFANCQLAICLQYAEQYYEAIQCLEKIQPAYEKQHPEIDYFLATCYAFNNDFEQSLTAVKTYLASGQTDFKTEAKTLLSQLVRA